MNDIREKIGVGCFLLVILALFIGVCWGLIAWLGWWTLLLPAFVIAGYCVSNVICMLENGSTFMAEIHKDIQSLKDAMQ